MFVHVLYGCLWLHILLLFSRSTALEVLYCCCYTVFENTDILVVHSAVVSVALALSFSSCARTLYCAFKLNEDLSCLCHIKDHVF